MTISTTARQIAEEWAAPGTVPDLELAILRHMEHHLAAAEPDCSVSASEVRQNVLQARIAELEATLANIVAKTGPPALGMAARIISEIHCTAKAALEKKP
jgi:hypothetical protein